MAPTPSQLVWRARIENGLRVAAPLLDLVLAGGERLSRILVPADEPQLPTRAVRAIPESRAQDQAPAR